MRTILLAASVLSSVYLAAVAGTFWLLRVYRQSESGAGSAGGQATIGCRRGRLALLLEILRTHTLRDVAAALVPKRFDILLYEGDAETLASAPPLEGASDICVERFNAQHRSGIAEIDEKAVGSREVYVVRIDGRLAHLVVLTWDIRLPAQFGFDPKAPVMDLGFTWPEFRGRRLQPTVRRYVTADVIRRGLYHKVYGGIAAGNIASQHGNARAGMRRVARLQGWRVCGFALFKKVLPWESEVTRTVPAGSILRSAS